MIELEIYGHLIESQVLGDNVINCLDLINENLKPISKLLAVHMVEKRLGKNT